MEAPDEPAKARLGSNAALAATAILRFGLAVPGRAERSPGLGRYSIPSESLGVSNLRLEIDVERRPQKCEVLAGRPTRTTFGTARYVGGNSGLGPPQRGHLFFTTEVVGIGDKRATSAVIPLASVQSVEVSGGEVAVSKIPAILALGVIGGFASKGSKFESAVIVCTQDGETAYYTVDHESPVSVRAKLTPILKRAGVPLVDEERSVPLPPQPSASISVADELAKLASLRSDGVLTDEEFAAQKGQTSCRWQLALRATVGPCRVAPTGDRGG